MSLTCNLKKIAYKIPGWYAYRETECEVKEVCNVEEPHGIQTIAVYEFVEEGKPEKQPDCPEGMFDMIYLMYDPTRWIF
jgi:hypothetical protein